MNKNTSIMAGAILAAGILTISVVTHLAFAQNQVYIHCPAAAAAPQAWATPMSQSAAGDQPKQGAGGEGNTHIAIGGGGECMSGGAGGAGGEGGQGGTNLVKDTDKNADVNQDANGGKSNGGYGGNANGGDGLIR